MNTAPLKAYAPKARRDFISAVSAQAARYGITASGIASATAEGDLLLIDGQAFPRHIDKGRRQLAEQVETRGFDATMEAAAYTWFNRFMALRYMEVHGYLDHGYRVLSHPGGQPRPEILDHAADVDLPSLDRDEAVALQLDGTQDEELYRLLLKAQCAELHAAMPFLFDKLGGATELLLPANLLHSDSLIRELVDAIEEEAWQHIEVVGWLYQFYISEKKDQVIGKKVASEDIPAATQLFTPNWIVKYLVQNSLGAQWLATYPDSPLKAQMDYYIEPAEQTAEVQAQLDAVTPDSLDPETLTLMDPACGSGHILVEAYDLFNAIYLERGYRQRDVPRLILEKNLYGLDIDPRAAQLTGFALMMKGRADDRRLFSRGVTLNVMALIDSADLDVLSIAANVSLPSYGLSREDLAELKSMFGAASVFGSLIRVPAGVQGKLDAVNRLCRESWPHLLLNPQLELLGQLARQARALAHRHANVAANPPYMGGRFMNRHARDYIRETFPGCERDLFAAFIARCVEFNTPHGRTCLMTPFVWMFIASYTQLREHLIAAETVQSLVQLEFSAFPEATVPICIFALQSGATPSYVGRYIRLADFSGWANQEPRFLEAAGDPSCPWLFEADQSTFSDIPSAPFVYWGSENARRNYARHPVLGEVCAPRQGLATGDNGRFVRAWHEVEWGKVGLGCESSQAALESGARWFPYNKGGKFRKWYGNNESVVDWSSDGHEIKNFLGANGRQRSRTQNTRYYFREGIVYSLIGSVNFGARYKEHGFVFDVSGASIFPEQDVKLVLAFLCSRVASYYLRMLSPTVNFQVGDLARLPLAPLPDSATSQRVMTLANTCIDSAKRDWDLYERSWDFAGSPLVAASCSTLSESLDVLRGEQQGLAEALCVAEAEINEVFIKLYGLESELAPDVSLQQATLTGNPSYAYGGDATQDERWQRWRKESCEALVSYAVGCMMGRYSLDSEGLVYAGSRGDGFQSDACKTFQADDDGIVPVLDSPWFKDDALGRLVAFLGVAWPIDQLEANLQTLAETLGLKRGETPRAGLRRYLLETFYTYHVNAYGKRPIYWLFSSGRRKAFQCFVYLHRYNEGTLARMRSEYVIPLQGKVAARMEQLQGDIRSATSTAHRKRLEKELAQLEKQQVELLAFDEKLRHYADKRIALDLDEGVKVNYGKFGDLLAEVSKVHGKKPVVEVG